MRSKPLSLTLISVWCWLNVVAMLPTFTDPVVVLFGFGAFLPMHALNSVVTLIIIAVLIKQRTLFRLRSATVHVRHKSGKAI